MGPHESIQVEEPSKQRDLRIRNSREKLPAFMPKLCGFRGAPLLLSFTKVTLSTTAESAIFGYCCSHTSFSQQSSEAAADWASGSAQRFAFLSLPSHSQTVIEHELN